MKRYYNINEQTYNNYCDKIDETFMVEIPNEGKPYGEVDGYVVDISETEEYIHKCRNCEKTKIVKNYNIKFTEFDIAWSAKVSRGLATTQEMNTARGLLVTELQAELERVGE